jgi:hypothetical protein
VDIKSETQLRRDLEPQGDNGQGEAAAESA